MSKQQLLKINVSHPDPEIEKQGVEAVKNFIQMISQITGEEVEIIEDAPKKQAPHWMDCNCLCHGTWGENPDTIGKTCPHCHPELYQNQWRSRVKSTNPRKSRI